MKQQKNIMTNTEAQRHYFPEAVWKNIKYFMIETDTNKLIYLACKKFYEKNSKLGIIKAYNRRHKYRFCYFKHHHGRESDLDGTYEIERSFFYSKGFMKNNNCWQKYTNNTLQYNIRADIFRQIHARAKWKNAKGHVLIQKY
jgi:hypothetical protein